MELVFANQVFPWKGGREPNVQHRHLLLLTDGRVQCSECGREVDSMTIRDEQLKLENPNGGR